MQGAFPARDWADTVRCPQHLLHPRAVQEPRKALLSAPCEPQSWWSRLLCPQSDLQFPAFGTKEKGRAFIKAQSSSSELGVLGRDPGSPWTLWNYMQAVRPTHLLCISLVKASVVSPQTQMDSWHGKSLRTTALESLNWKQYVRKAQTVTLWGVDPYTVFLLKDFCGPKNGKFGISKQ